MDLISSISQRTTVCFFRMRLRFATAGVGLLAFVLAYHVVFGANCMVVYRQKRAEYHALQQQMLELQQESKQLDQQVRALKTDPRAIEKEAREQLRYTRPGERVFLLPETAPAANASQAAA